jgi:penicillin-binding protein 1C
VGLAAAVAMLAWLAWLAWPAPRALLVPREGVVLTDRHGHVLATRGRGAVPEPGLGAFGERLVVATLAAEDHRFRWHPGVDPVGVLRAARANLEAGRVVQGGSTLTQQLARRLVPRGPGLAGKLAEARLALGLETALSKDEILAAYLARTWYGNGATGADVAARAYFDREAPALSLAQGATLAAIPRRPADLDPLRRPGLVRSARDRVLARVGALGWATADEVAEAMAEPLQTFEPAFPDEAPHFVRRVLATGGAGATTLDLPLQHAAETAVDETLADLAGHHVTQAAVIAVENRTGGVLAYVGSADWRGPSGQVDGVTAPRSPGSALKPFTYALALEAGATLADLVDDSPTTWRTTHGNWRPRNYGGGSRGPVTLREALGNSLNVPAARVLERVGPADLHRRLRDLGVTTLDERADHYGLGLTLGDGEVRLDELAAAYATFANRGTWRPLRFRRDEPVAAPRRVTTPEAAFLVADALDDADARAAAFGADAVLEAAYPMAAKTGTSTGWRDNLAIGVTPGVTAAVWVGNFDGSGMAEVSGVTGAGPILRRVMDAAMEGRSRRAFEAPKSLELRRVCPLSGGLAGASCPTSRDEWLPVGRARRACGLHGAPEADAGSVAVTYPAANASFRLDARRPVADQAIPLRATTGGAAEARWLVDDAVIAAVQAPFVARWVPTPGLHRIAVEAGGLRSAPVTVWVD